MGPFAFASLNAWMLGRPDVARERMAQMLESANNSNPYDTAFAAYFPAGLMGYLRQYEQAAESAVRALELSERYQFPDIAALSPVVVSGVDREVDVGTGAGPSLVTGHRCLAKIDDWRWSEMNSNPRTT
jgi:hypothetical protein